MKITNKAKKSLTKYFGEEKTQQIISTAVIKFNRLDENKVEDILGISNFYTDFWDFVEKDTKEIHKDFLYIYDLLVSNSSPYENNIKFKFIPKGNK